MNLHHSLDGIVPMARPYFDALLERAESWGMRPVIGDALRTCDDQAGASSSAVKVRSWHVLGRAVDLELQGVDAYRQLGEWWESVGGTWGGRWTTLYPPNGDFEHFQWSGGRDGIPDEVWPAGEACETARASYLASDAAQTAPAGPVVSVAGAPRRQGALVAGALLGGASALLLWRVLQHA